MIILHCIHHLFTHRIFTPSHCVSHLQQELSLASILHTTCVIFVICVDGLLYSLIYLINCTSFLLVPINVRFATLERIMRCVCPLRNQDTLVYMLCTCCAHTAYTTAYQSYNCPNGYNAFTFLFLDKQEGLSTATIAMKCNWTHICEENHS